MPKGGESPWFSELKGDNERAANGEKEMKVRVFFDLYFFFGMSTDFIGIVDAIQ